MYFYDMRKRVNLHIIIYALTVLISTFPDIKELDENIYKNISTL